MTTTTLATMIMDLDHAGPIGQDGLMQQIERTYMHAARAMLASCPAGRDIVDDDGDVIAQRDGRGRYLVHGEAVTRAVAEEHIAADAFESHARLGEDDLNAALANGPLTHLSIK